jgi:hypothetical protein
MRPFLVLAAAAVWACSDSTGNANETCPDAQVPLCLSGDSTRALITPVATDAGSRSLGALANAAARGAIGIELDAVGAAIVAGQVTQARAALARARTALAAARQQLTTNPGDAPDLAAIELALIQIELAIQ